MLNLTENQPGNHHFIREVHVDRVVINDRSFSSSVVVGARFLQEHWPVRSLSDLTEDTLEPLLALKPELVVVGLGSKPVFPGINLQRIFFGRGIGLECMSLSAAARTFNILMSEDRRALAALIL
jgi:uncharacterized protein